MALADPLTRNVRFAIHNNAEPDFPGDQFFLEIIDADTGEVLEAFNCEDPYREVEAFREVESAEGDFEKLMEFAAKGGRKLRLPIGATCRDS